MSNTGSIKIIILFAVIGYLVVLFYTLNNPQVAHIGDAAEYIKEAENILQYRTVYCGDLSEKIDPALYSQRPPFYPFFIATFILLFKNHCSVLFFQILLTILNAYLILKILDSQNVTHQWKIIVLICFLFYPAQIIYTNIIMSELLLQTFLVSSFYFLIKYSAEKKIIYLLLLNLCLSGAVLTKPVMIYFWIPNILYHLWLFYRDRRKTILALPFIFILTISIWSYRNYRLTGVYHYSSIKNHNLLDYNIHGFLARKLGLYHANTTVTLIEQRAEQQPTYKKSYNYIEKESVKIIRKNLIGYAIYHLQGMLTFSLDPGRFDIYNFLQIENSKGFSSMVSQYGFKGIFPLLKEIPITIILYLAFMVLLNTLFFGSFLYFLLTSYNDKIFKTYILLICIYIAFVTGPMGASRFRLPIYPFIILTFPLIKRC